jgi:hypothetical protein
MGLPPTPIQDREDLLGLEAASVAPGREAAQPVLKGRPCRIIRAFGVWDGDWNGDSL